VSRIAGLLDEQVQAFRERPLEGRYPYLFVDAKIEKVRDGGRVQRKAVVVAHAVHETGRREIIGSPGAWSVSSIAPALQIVARAAAG
jgi:transposase-like protein